MNFSLFSFAVTKITPSGETELLLNKAGADRAAKHVTAPTNLGWFNGTRCIDTLQCLS